MSKCRCIITARDGVCIDIRGHNPECIEINGGCIEPEIVDSWACMREFMIERSLFINGREIPLYICTDIDPETMSFELSTYDSSAEKFYCNPCVEYDTRYLENVYSFLYISINGNTEYIISTSIYLSREIGWGDDCNECCVAAVYGEFVAVFRDSDSKYLYNGVDGDDIYLAGSCSEIERTQADFDKVPNGELDAVYVDLDDYTMKLRFR